MTELQSLREQASRIDAVITCDCGFDEDFATYLGRDDRVDEANESIEFGCPSCGSDTVNLGKKVNGTNTIIVNGLEELEQIAGE